MNYLMNNNHNSDFGNLLAFYSTNNNNHDKLTTLIIGSLNFRSFAKLFFPEKRQSFARHLRLQSLDILSLQDTNAEDESTQSALNILFNFKSTFWAKHCGVMCLNPSITVTHTLVTVDQRLIICEVPHKCRMFEPFTLVNLYTPPQRAQNRMFFEHLLSLPPFSSFSTDGSFLSPLPRHLPRVLLPIILTMTFPEVSVVACKIGIVIFNNI